MVVIDALARFIPGVLGADDGAADDSYASGLLEGPTITRPATFEQWRSRRSWRSGNHAAVAGAAAHGARAHAGGAGLTFSRGPSSRPRTVECLAR